MKKPCSFLLSCLAGAALASTLPPLPPAAPPPPAVPGLLAQAGLDAPVFIGEGAVNFVTGAAGGERVVKGAPYCAEAEQETVQWLADGQGGAPNRVTRRVSTQLCRDGEGRTRQEIGRGGRTLVYLRDPVARESWLLDPERKTARPVGGGHAIAVESALVADHAERLRDWARNVASRARQAASEAGAAGAPLPPLPPPPPGAAQPVVIERTLRSAPGETRREVQVIRLSQEAAPGLEVPTPPPGVQWRAQVLAPRGPATVQALPARDIEGLRAHGERSSWVIEAGKVGNEKPIQILREVWTSPELMLTLQTRDFDPRSGEVNYRLKNLKRGEPDPALMRVPADYARPAPKAPATRSAPAAG
ncbi:hypothetical protein [Rubrivivax rivuli]|uniref:Uncharacterized protein n=1 Tax=Rubrivivax rivuli TaxID=1862385 RepID=A0A437RSJ2_9BURK|nr:hypothetical protein [Rubrivivax rivuli]RVU49725.1 hypothetical protein EOE66_04015 [Rubrivivax rivuli]